ncbi:MAG: glycosyl transferase family A [Bacteroidetes bacterium HGW-Bacteroidetes-10]|nr:MAG: glycosyl transferase family A [Bacteroidetes bacterium HGW-Bacteroidetes-10]
MWYRKYLQTLDKSLDEQDSILLDQIRESVANFQNNEPIATIAIIAYNEEKRILPCIWSLCENITSNPVEIICINNASSDRTEDLFKRIGIRYFNESRKSAGYARQKGLVEARGKYYFCIDADTLYPPFYIETMIKALQGKDVVAVSSQYNFIPEIGISRLTLTLYEIIRDFNSFVLSIKRPELTVRGSVFAFITEIGKREGFRVNIKRGEDGAMASYLKNYGKIILVRSRKARAYTSAAPLLKDGGIIRALFTRISFSLRMISAYFTRKTKYEDQESNLIDNEKNK